MKVLWNLFLLLRISRTHLTYPKKTIWKENMKGKSKKDFIKISWLAWTCGIFLSLFFFLPFIYHFFFLLFLLSVFNIIIPFQYPELCINPLSKASSRISNYSSWERCGAPQYSEWHDAVSGGHIPAKSWCWWGLKEFQCNA